MHKKLKSIREELGFSIREMAKELVLLPATYQGYESGRRKMPASILKMAQESLRMDRQFFKRYLPGGEFDKELSRQYPCGIRSEISSQEAR